MNIMLLLEMAAGAAPDRLALGERADGLSYEHLYDLAGRAAAEFQGLGVERVVYAAESSPALPVALFGAAWAGMPFVPVNYRLADDRLRLIASRQVPAVLLCDAGTEHRFAGIDGLTLVTVGGFLTGITGLEPLAPEWSQDPEDIAVLLHTSGTSGEPKAAVLRHRHLSQLRPRRGRVPRLPARTRHHSSVFRRTTSQGSRRSSRRCTADADSFSCPRSRPTSGCPSPAARESRTR